MWIIPEEILFIYYKDFLGMILMKGCQLVRPLGILSSPRIISKDFEKNGLDMHFMAEDEAYLTTIQCIYAVICLVLDLCTKWCKWCLSEFYTVEELM